MYVLLSVMHISMVVMVTKAYYMFSTRKRPEVMEDRALSLVAGVFWPFFFVGLIFKGLWWVVLYASGKLSDFVFKPSALTLKAWEEEDAKKAYQTMLMDVASNAPELLSANDRESALKLISEELLEPVDIHTFRKLCEIKTKLRTVDLQGVSLDSPREVKALVGQAMETS